jgi:hypothetical protein
MNHLARSLAIILAAHPRLAGLVLRILNYIERKIK